MTVGKLYEKLVVGELPIQSYHEYYELVKKTIAESDEDFKTTEDLDECAKRWHGHD